MGTTCQHLIFSDLCVNFCHHWDSIKSNFRPIETFPKSPTWRPNMSSRQELLKNGCKCNLAVLRQVGLCNPIFEQQAEDAASTAAQPSVLKCPTATCNVTRYHTSCSGGVRGIRRLCCVGSKILHMYLSLATMALWRACRNKHLDSGRDWGRQGLNPHPIFFQASKVYIFVILQQNTAHINPHYGTKPCSYFSWRIPLEARTLLHITCWEFIHSAHTEVCFSQVLMSKIKKEPWDSWTVK